LQCSAVCCSVLQCAAVCCSVLQCVAVCCSVLQCAFTCRGAFRLQPQRVAVVHPAPSVRVCWTNSCLDNGYQSTLSLMSARSAITQLSLNETARVITLWYTRRETRWEAAIQWAATQYANHAKRQRTVLEEHMSVQGGEDS